MNTDVKLRIQETLDQLLNENLIPFALTARAVHTEDPGTYMVQFYDSRIHSFRFTWDGHSPSLEGIVRAAVLDRIQKMDSAPPLHLMTFLPTSSTDNPTQ